MAQIGGRRDAGNTSIWMLVAIAAVAGLLIWIFFATQRVQDVAIVDADPANGEVAGEVTPVRITDLESNPEPHAGNRVVVRNVEVDGLLGSRTFWANAGPGRQFLVVIPETAGEVEAGQRLGSLEGTVRESSQEVLRQFIQAGALREDAFDDALFATHYLDVHRMVR
jgi:hypothetical protein